MEAFIKFCIGVVAVVALVLSGMTFNRVGQLAQVIADLQSPVGATPGTEFQNPTTFLQPATMGGNVFATSSAGTATYTAASLQNTSVIQHTATAALTVTLPASSTLGAFIPRPGDTRTIFINAITTKITLAGGTGTDLNTASSTKDVIAGGVARLDFVRKVNTDIEVLMTTGI